MCSVVMGDPYAILGVDPGAPPSELTAAYREQAKRWHPDRNGDAESERRMAQVNAAYDLLRAGGWSPQQPSARPERDEAPAVRGRGWWLAPAVRRGPRGGGPPGPRRGGGNGSRPPPAPRGGGPGRPGG